MGQSGKLDAQADLSSVEHRRRRNLRQLLLRASRIVNRHVVAGLHARGYADLRSTHTTLLSNIELAGSTVTEAAERAGITKQAMGRLATELQHAGYITVRSDPADARNRVLHLTKSGIRLMLDSLQVMADLQRGYVRALGRAQFSTMLDGLEDFIACAEPDRSQTR